MTYFDKICQTNCPLLLVSIITTIIFIPISLTMIRDLRPDNYQEAAGVVDYVGQNIKLPPINDILVSNVCPQGYNMEALFIWPGTDFGCSVGEKVSLQCPYLFDTDLKEEPIKINKKDPQAFYNWHDQSVCTKRLQNYKFVPTQEKCPQGLKKCSHELCVGQAEKCPISSLKITKKNGFVISQHSKTTEKISFNDDYYLLYNRNPAHSPLSIISVMVRDRPCLSNGFYPKKESQYPLLRAQNGCGKFDIDNQAFIIDNYPEYSFYKDNGFHQQTTELKNYQESIADDKAMLIARSHLQIVPKPECYKIRNEWSSSLTTDAMTLDVYSGWIISFLVLEALLFLYSIIALGHVLLKPEDALAVHLGNKVFFFVLTLFALVCLMPLCMGMRFQAKDVMIENQYFRQMARHECFMNPNVRQAVKDFETIGYDVPSTLIYKLNWLGAIALFRVYIGFVIQRKSRYD